MAHLSRTIIPALLYQVTLPQSVLVAVDCKAAPRDHKTGGAGGFRATVRHAKNIPLWYPRVRLCVYHLARFISSTSDIQSGLQSLMDPCSDWERLGSGREGALSHQ